LGGKPFRAPLGIGRRRVIGVCRCPGCDICPHAANRTEPCQLGSMSSSRRCGAASQAAMPALPRARSPRTERLISRRLATSTARRQPLQTPKL
jgi:hypothetical protein